MFFQAPRIKKNTKKHLVIFKTDKNIFNYNSILKCGMFGLKTIEDAYLLPEHFEIIRRIFSRNIKKNMGQLWIYAKPQVSKTKKPNEIRMGKGKGPVKNWYLPVKRGTILFEITGLPFFIAKILINISAKKLPVKTIFYAK